MEIFENTSTFIFICLFCLLNSRNFQQISGLGMVLYQILFKLEPFSERNMSHTSNCFVFLLLITSIDCKSSELLQKIAMSSEDDQIIRPVFPNQQNIASTEEAYNLQLLSVGFIFSKQFYFI